MPSHLERSSNAQRLEALSEKLSRYLAPMTANARQEDRHSCPATRMNYFLSRPIDPNVLWGTLLKWVKPLKTALPAQLESPPASNADTDLPHGISGLDVRKGLRHMMDKKPFYITMLRKYVSGQQASVQHVRHALDSEDTESALQIAHTFRGVSAALGAPDIAGHAARLEAALREKRPGADMANVLAAIQISLEKLIRELQAWLSIATTTPTLGTASNQ